MRRSSLLSGSSTAWGRCSSALVPNGLTRRRTWHALGSRDDVERLLAAADLVVSSSVSESFSNALAEGMAAGLPAVATDVGDSARIVGSTGRIVPPRDPVALAEAMGALLGESKTARAARGIEARRRIETRFSIERALVAHSAFYASLM